MSSVNRFYFLEYFYIILQSIDRYAIKGDVFESFKILKQEHQLGESKYRIRINTHDISKTQEDRYLYTFDQVVGEAKAYGLVITADHELFLTEHGAKLLRQYKLEGVQRFNQSLFVLMEEKYAAFRYLVSFLYSLNKSNPGLLILPTYSPRQLGFERSKIETTRDIIKYSNSLVSRLTDDIRTYLGEHRDLWGNNQNLINRLKETKIIPPNDGDKLDPSRYNVIIKRFRDAWITYFLREIYNFESSLSTFDIWMYRGKQIGIIHASEFYPNFTGRIVYPTSVLAAGVSSRDFEQLIEYEDGNRLYIHKPMLEDQNQQKFLGHLVNGYFDLRRSYASYFINLSALRELVCYNMKMSEVAFETFLDSAYRLNLAGNLQVRISLEVDKLPEETKGMYLKRVPVMVGGRYRNIIAIDVAKGGSYEQPL